MAQAPEKAQAPVPGGIPEPPAKETTRPVIATPRGAMAHELAVEVTGTETVTVACKHPAGFRLRLHRKHEEMEPIMGGGQRKVTIYRPSGQEVFIKGTAKPQGEAPRAEMSGGYALTHGVPKAFWDAWLKDHASWGPVVTGLLFAHESPAMVRDGAKANAARLTGLERMDPNKLPAGIVRADAPSKAA